MVTTKSITNLSNLSKMERESINKINWENLICNGGTLRLSNILTWFDEGDNIVLAYDNDEIIGYALIKKPINEGIGFMKSCAGEITDNNFSWSKIVSNPNALYIAQIAIAKDKQGCGVATTIIESMNNFIIVSNARAKNTRSHKMHLKNGFQIIGGSTYKNELYDVLYYRDVKKCV